MEGDAFRGKVFRDSLVVDLAARRATKIDQALRERDPELLAPDCRKLWAAERERGRRLLIQQFGWDPQAQSDGVGLPELSDEADPLLVCAFRDAVTAFLQADWLLYWTEGATAAETVSFPLTPEGCIPTSLLWFGNRGEIPQRIARRPEFARFLQGETGSPDRDIDTMFVKYWAARGRAQIKRGRYPRLDQWMEVAYGNDAAGKAHDAEFAVTAFALAGDVKGVLSGVPNAIAGTISKEREGVHGFSIPLSEPEERPGKKPRKRIHLSSAALDDLTAQGFEPATRHPGPEAAVIEQEAQRLEQERLDQFGRELPQAQQIVFHLWRRGCAEEEIGRRTGMRRRTVRTHIERIEEKIRRIPKADAEG